MKFYALPPAIHIPHTPMEGGSLGVKKKSWGEGGVAYRETPATTPAIN